MNQFLLGVIGCMHFHVDLADGNAVLVKAPSFEEHREHLIFAMFRVEEDIVEEFQSDHFCQEIDGVNVDHGGLLICLI